MAKCSRLDPCRRLLILITGTLPLVTLYLIELIVDSVNAGATSNRQRGFWRNPVTDRPHREYSFAPL